MKKIIINYNSWQTRIAITRNGDMHNVYFSGHAQETLERVFFKGTVLKVLPGIQTAFVDIGQEKAGFLHISEIDRELAIQKISKHTQIDREKYPRRKQKLDISKIFKEGENILIQVSKEPVYEKGAKLTTCFTLPGRFIVFMPNIPRLGVSKRIADREERIRLKDIVQKHLPKGMGAIIRTTSEECDEKEIVKDLKFLIKTWNTIQKKFKTAEPKEKIYEDLALSLQIIRDHLADDVQAVITNDKKNQQRIYNFVKAIAPEYSHKIQLYKGQINIFDYYNIEQQLEQALEKKVELKSGGSLIIETTEAMTVIDVNTGKFIGKKNLEETILQTNLEAAEEIVRQLKLRNIGGLIVIDFIDMAIHVNKQRLFRFFEKILREQDKFQSVVLKISEFGLVQMTRKRSGKTLIQQLTNKCKTCIGYGFIKSTQTESYAVLRNLRTGLAKMKWVEKVTFSTNPAVFDYVTSVEYNAILEIEKEFKIKITFLSNNSCKVHEYKIEKK